MRSAAVFVAALAGLLIAVSGPAALAAPDDEPPLPQGPETTAPDEPPLPQGPGGEDAPPLPQGPGGGDAPPLPAGPGEAGGDLPPIGNGGGAPPPIPDIDALPDSGQGAGGAADGWFDFTGFIEVRGGVRTQPDRHEPDASMGEARLQLRWDHAIGPEDAPISLKVVGDLVWDQVALYRRVDLEEGQGFFDLREAHASFSPAPSVDVRVGRQINTWGTGDLIFINDLFPKDWRSFLLGRDVEYLKAPSDALRVGLFGDLANLDFVYVPRFDSDRYVTGERLSYYNAALGRRAGRDAIVRPDRPDDCFRDDEFHTRLYRRVGSVELAAYGYWGYWKSPGGLRPTTGQATFPHLNVYGASARGPGGGGIWSLEGGYYDSQDDRDGDDPFVNNSQVRLLAGFERDVPELMQDLTVGLQYYVEWMMDHGSYRRTLPPGVPAADEVRHMVTLRLTKQLMNQNLKLSLFAFYSPSDQDAYLRPHVSYRIDDHWSVEAGANVFFGRDDHTFFGQFERNTNIYAALRYGF